MSTIRIGIFIIFFLFTLGGCGESSSPFQSDTNSTAKNKIGDDHNNSGLDADTGSNKPDSSGNSPGSGNVHDNNDNTDTTEENTGNTSSNDQNTTNSGNTEETRSALIYTKLNNNLYLNEKKDVAVYIADDLNKSEKLIYNSTYLTKITNTLYNHFKDDYDFIFLITNNKERPKSVTYSGVFLKVKNDVEGIGAPLYSHSDQYGSSGNLKGIMHFAYRGAILRGPTLHEISHYWANKFKVGYTDKGTIDSNSYVIGKSGHWGYTGFYGGKGQLGGFDAKNDDLRVEKDKDGNDLTYESKSDGTWKVYSAKNFGWNANGAGRIPYNDLELYLMGFISKDEVQDLIVPISYGSPLTPELKEYLVDNNLSERGRNYFMCREMVRKSWEEIMRDHNISDRNPNYQASQKSFKVLTVLLDTTMPQLHEVNSISTQMEKFTRKGDDGIATNHNFWEATRGLGELHSNELDQSLKTTGEAYPIANNFVSEEISFHGKTYKTIQSPYTGRVWLDRNLDADHVCSSLTDEGCYGGYFQFGRGFDGHEVPDSPMTTEKKNTIHPQDNQFVLSTSGTGYDWVKSGVDDNASKRLAFVSDTSGSGICPDGFRLPTIDELYAETSLNEPWDHFPARDISQDFLKLPFNGYRNAQDARGVITEKDIRGAYWSSSSFISAIDGDVRIRHMLFFEDDLTAYGTLYLGNGDGVRCIQEN